MRPTKIRLYPLNTCMMIGKHICWQSHWLSVPHPAQPQLLFIHLTIVTSTDCCHSPNHFITSIVTGVLYDCHSHLPPLISLTSNIIFSYWFCPWVLPQCGQWLDCHFSASDDVPVLGLLDFKNTNGKMNNSCKFILSFLDLFNTISCLFCII